MCHATGGIEMKLNEAICKRIFDLCNQNNISIDGLTTSAKLDCAVLTSLINGENIDIPLDVMDRICMAMGSTMPDFFMCKYFENLER